MNILDLAKPLLQANGGMLIPAAGVGRLTKASGASIAEIMLQMIPLAKARARPAISGFQVGAVARGVSGALYLGANLEFAGCSLGQKVHAEQATIINAALHGETGLSALAVSAPPCGYCRQFLQELAGADRLEILLADKPAMRLSDYLPGAFGPADLGVIGGLLASPPQRLRWAGAALPGPAGELALRAAQNSYAPYTKAFAAASLTTRSGDIFVGPYLENAAFNPSVGPVQAAAVALMLAGHGIEEITSAAIVQPTESKIDHAAAAHSLLQQVAPGATVQVGLIRNEPEGAQPMAKQQDLSFYFFDFDDNIMFLTTPILIRNTATNRSRKVTTAEFAGIRTQFGQPGPWQQFEIYADTYSHFRDIAADKLKPGAEQHFVTDVARAIAGPTTAWQGPSWPLFVHACEKQRPMAIVTARGHSPETLEAGIRVLADKKLIPREPNYLVLCPVGNDKMAEDLLASLTDDAERERIRALPDRTSALKRIAIRTAVEMALEKYGAEPEHRFGMSDDDPQNVDLIIKAMCDCKVKHPTKRFFVINTHQGEWVKLEVFPVAYPVTGRAPANELIG